MSWDITAIDTFAVVLDDNLLEQILNSKEKNRLQIVKYTKEYFNTQEITTDDLLHYLNSGEYDYDILCLNRYNLTHCYNIDVKTGRVDQHKDLDDTIVYYSLSCNYNLYDAPFKTFDELKEEVERHDDFLKEVDWSKSIYAVSGILQG